MIKILLYTFIAMSQIYNYSVENHNIREFSYEFFEHSIQIGKEYECSDIKSMVVPHHLLAADLIANMYKTAANEDVRKILIISPDHNSRTGKKVITSKKDWVGKYGIVKSNKEFTDRLLSFDFVFEDDYEIEVEHGINVHIPYISKYFPNAEITSLAVSKEVKNKDLELILSTLDESTFVIASVDFSHYKSLHKANEYDEITKKIMKSGDYEKFRGLSDAYFDSAPSLYFIFRFANSNGFEFNILDHSNSANYLSPTIPETTSYYLIGFN